MFLVGELFPYVYAGSLEWPTQYVKDLMAGVETEIETKPPVAAEEKNVLSDSASDLLQI